MDWERKRGRKKSKPEDREGKCGIFGERSSTFSLEFPTIGPVARSGARGRVDPHSESFASRPYLESFDKLRKGRGFSPTCFYFSFKGSCNGWGFVEAWMAVVSIPTDLDQVKKSL